MIRLRVLLHRIFGSLFKSRSERELHDELQSHIEMQIEENIQSGMNADEARYAALKKLGGIEQTKESYRDKKALTYIESFLSDLRFASRVLIKRPMFTAICISILAIGIGANTAIFSVVNTVIFNAVPYKNARRLVWMTHVFNEFEIVGRADYLRWKMWSKSYDGMTAYRTAEMLLTERGELTQLEVIRATTDFFSVLGIEPVEGRPFTREEDQPGGQKVAIISHNLKQKLFKPKENVIGQSLILASKKHLIIGVMPAGFKFTNKTDILLPYGIDVQRELSSHETTADNKVIGLLKHDVSIEQANEEGKLIVQRVNQLESRPPSFVSKVEYLNERLVGHLKTALWTLFIVVSLVLLIVCINISNLMTTHWASRYKEMAIRAAVGAGRGRLIRQILIENILFSVCGGIIGILFTMLCIKALILFTPGSMPQIKETTINVTVLFFILLTSLLTGFITAIFPVLYASRINLSEHIKGGGDKTFSLKSKGLLRIAPVLVVTEIALTVALLIGSGLLVHSYIKYQAINPGYNPENLLTLTIPNTLNSHQSIPERKQYYESLISGINTIPGVTLTAMGESIPMADTQIPHHTPFNTLKGSNRSSELRQIQLNVVSRDYIDALGMQLVAGRTFNKQDHESSTPVIIINEATVKQFDGENPIDKPIVIDDHICTVIGIAKNAKLFGLEEEVRPELYSLYTQNIQFSQLPRLIIRTTVDPLTISDAVSKQIRAINRKQPIQDVLPMSHYLWEATAPRRFQMLLFGAFAVTALLLAAIGIYGTISQSVSMRTHEIGIRMSLGADKLMILKIVLKQGASLTIIGLFIGIVTASLLTTMMKSLLFNIKATDPLSYIIGSMFLLCVILFAVYIPARRATKIDPINTLRCE